MLMNGLYRVMEKRKWYVFGNLGNFGVRKFVAIALQRVLLLSMRIRSVSLLGLLLFLLGVCVPSVVLANRLRAIRRGEGANTLRDTRIGGRLGGHLSFLQTGGDRILSAPYFGYQYGVEMLVPVDDYFEIALSGLANWKGGQLTHTFADAGGQGVTVDAQMRILAFRMGLFGNYVYRIPHDWDIFVGVGMLPQIQLSGRMKLKIPEGMQSYDLDVGFDSDAHLFPLNFGLGAQAGVRFLSTLSLSVWYEYDFLNLLPKQKRFYGNVAPDYLLRNDFSRPFVQSLERLSSQAVGISFVYYIKL